MKKILAMIMATALVGSLAACGNTDSKTDSTTATTTAQGSDETTDAAEDVDFTGRTVTVGIWGGNDGETAGIEQMKADFEAKTGATVEFKIYTDYNTQIQADFIGNTAPDAFYIDANVFPFYSTLDVMEPLNADEMGLSAYYENLIAAFTAEDGTVYCVPKDVSTLATYYNIDLLESVGFTADDIPDSYEEYMTFLVDLQNKLDETYGANQIAAMTYNQDMARNLYLLENGGNEVIDADGMPLLSSDANVETLEFINEFVQAGVWKTPSDLGLGWNGEAFGTGKTVIMEEGNWVYGTLKNDYSDINFGVKDMPTYKGERASMVFTVGYGISANSENKDLAKEWIKYATGIDGMATWVSAAGCLPSRADVAEKLDVANDPVLKVHSDMTAIAYPWQAGTTVTIINSAFQNYWPLVVSGDMTVAEAMTEADAQARSEIENAQ